MAKHKFIKPKRVEMDEAGAMSMARVEGPQAMAARSKLASMGKNIPGRIKPKGVAMRMKSRYGDH